MRAGDRIEVQIEKPVYQGQGLGRLEGRVVFVSRGLPGDRLAARVVRVERDFARARIEEVLAPGPGRRDSPCPYVPACGGCSYQELDYPQQLALKEAVLRDTLERAGSPWPGAIVLTPSPETGWRTRASLHFRATRGGLLLGFCREESHRVVDLDACLQLSTGLQAVARALRSAVAAQGPLAHGIRGLDLAESPDGSRRVAVLDTDLDVRAASRLAPLGEGIAGLTGFGTLFRDAGARRFLSLRGDPHLEATVAGFELRSHVRSFFQANRFLLEPLVREVVGLVPPGGRVLDLYSGVGLFTLPLAARADATEAVESSPEAVADAEANLAEAGLPGTRIRRGDVGEVLGALPGEPGERIVLDPPRTGAGPAVVEALAGRRPAVVVYVSCDPATLARDLALFGRRGYRVDHLATFDLFPDTFHLETVARLVAA